MDEKRLDLWDKATIIEMAAYPEKAKEMKEILHLARLGLWAREKGAPVLEVYCGANFLSHEDAALACNALSALPKEETE